MVVDAKRRQCCFEKIRRRRRRSCTWHKDIVAHHKAQWFPAGRDTAARIVEVMMVVVVLLVGIVVLLLLLLVVMMLVAVVVHRVSAGAACLLTPSVGNCPRSVGAFLDQRLVVLATRSRVNRAPALVAVVLKVEMNKNYEVCILWLLMPTFSSKKL